MNKFIILILLNLTILSLNAQKEGLDKLAHYPLIDHYGDITGQLDSLVNFNVEFADSSLYFDGAARNSDTANQVYIKLDNFESISE